MIENLLNGLTGREFEINVVNERNWEKAIFFVWAAGCVERI